MVSYVELVNRKASLWRAGRILKAWLAGGGVDGWLWEQLVREVVPLVAKCYCGKMVDFDDACSEVLTSLWLYFRRKGWLRYRMCLEDHLGSIIGLAVKRAIRECGRKEFRLRGLLGPFEVRKLVVSVPTVVSLRMAVREMPEIAYKRAVKHNRWGYEDEVLKLAIKFCLQGIENRERWKLFSSWFCVRDVEHLRSFAMLMVRWAMSDCCSRGIVYEEIEVSECVS